MNYRRKKIVVYVSNIIDRDCNVNDILWKYVEPCRLEIEDYQHSLINALLSSTNSLSKHYFNVKKRTFS